VFAVPGSPLDPRTRGGNDLLREGAILTETAGDVLDNLSGFGALFPSGSGLPGIAEEAPCDLEPPDQLEDRPNLDRARSQVVALLGPTPTKVDDLLRRCQLSPAAVMAVLLELELAGRVETLPGNRFALLTNAGS
jgi:DNA processing protein